MIHLFTGESGGDVRYMASPDINTEDFQAAVDFLANLDSVDADKIGVVGICGFGGMALNAAILDTRIKATVTSTMYDMPRVNANGYFDQNDSEEARYELKKSLNIKERLIIKRKLMKEQEDVYLYLLVMMYLFMLKIIVIIIKEEHIIKEV